MDMYVYFKRHKIYPANILCSKWHYSLENNSMYVRNSGHMKKYIKPQNLEET